MNIRIKPQPTPRERAMILLGPRMSAPKPPSLSERLRAIDWRYHLCIAAASTIASYIVLVMVR
jgi:hypothetical protein